MITEGTVFRLSIYQYFSEKCVSLHIIGNIIKTTHTVGKLNIKTLLLHQKFLFTTKAQTTILKDNSKYPATKSWLLQPHHDFCTKYKKNSLVFKYIRKYSIQISYSYSQF